MISFSLQFISLTTLLQTVNCEDKCQIYFLHNPLWCALIGRAQAGKAALGFRAACDLLQVLCRYTSFSFGLQSPNSSPEFQHGIYDSLSNTWGAVSQGPDHGWTSREDSVAQLSKDIAVQLKVQKSENSNSSLAIYSQLCGVLSMSIDLKFYSQVFKGHFFHILLLYILIINSPWQSGHSVAYFGFFYCMIASKEGHVILGLGGPNKKPTSQTF